MYHFLLLLQQRLLASWEPLLRGQGYHVTPFLVGMGVFPLSTLATHFIVRSYLHRRGQSHFFVPGMDPSLQCFHKKHIQIYV